MLAATILAAALLAPQTNLISNGRFGDNGAGWGVPGAGDAAVSFSDANPGRAIRVEVTRSQVTQAWDVQLRHPVSGAVRRGQAYSLSFLGRSPNAARIRALLQKASPDYAGIAGADFDLGTAWERFSVEGVAGDALPANGAEVTFHLAFKPGAIVELADVRVQAITVQMGSRERPTVLQTNGNFAQGFEPGWYRQGNVRTELESRGPGNRRSVRATFRPDPGAQPWSVAIGNTSSGRIAAGETVNLRVWMRSSTRARVTVNYELARAPHSKSLSQIVRLTPEWTEYLLPFRAGRAFAPEESRTVFFLGAGPGEMEIADLRVEALGETPLSSLPQTLDYFGGIPNPDGWRKAALARIERIRKGSLTVDVVGQNGRPVGNAVVRVEQLRHAFRFGTAGPAFRLVQDDPDSRRYREVLAQNFNTFTFENDLKWGNTTTPEQFQTLESAFQWLEKRDFAVRGHNLVWGSQQYLPAFVLNQTPDQQRETVRQRVRDWAGRFKGRVYLWDVVNEPSTERWLWDRIGWQELAEAFRIARAVDPNALLCLNDFNITEENQFGDAQRKRFIEICRELIASGAPFDVIGIQAHVGTPITPTGRVIEILDEMAKLGKRLEITEYDLGVWDDRVNGQHMADFLTACFSHPAVDGFVMWGFWEGQHWRAAEGGAMFSRDWSRRMAAREWERLVKGAWWTRATGRTALTGQYSVRAFYGTQRVTVTSGGRTATATVKMVPGKPARVVVRL